LDQGQPVDPPPGRVPAKVEVEQDQPGRQLRGGGQHLLEATGPTPMGRQSLRTQAEHERGADQLVVVHHEDGRVGLLGVRVRWSGVHR
jgi:hypothetical protein